MHFSRKKVKKKFLDTKVVIRSHKSKKHGQYNNQKEKDKVTVPADIASNNIVLLCLKHYIDCIITDLYIYNYRIY